MDWRQYMYFLCLCTVAIVYSYVLLVAVVIILLLRKKLSSVIKPIFHMRRKTKNTDRTKILKNYQNPGPKRYNQSGVKKMRNNFSDKLGDGQDFINEVTTIGTTNHVNIVAFLGFCSEGSKRALIYDFMPNGSLDNFFYAKKSKNKYTLTAEDLLRTSLCVSGLEGWSTCIGDVAHRFCI
ncbi:hypothetical protein CRYUN_Cryun09bG0173300 [Craigia yunnanensis]